MRFACNNIPVFTRADAAKADRMAALRQCVESFGLRPARMAPTVGDWGLPDPGLAGGVLNEVKAAAHGDRPAAFGFLFAATAAALRTRTGPAVLVTARRALAEFGIPYGYGLAQLGLDCRRLVLIEAGTDKDALWAIEETLRSRVRPAMTAAAITGHLDLTASRRLNLAAAPEATPLVLLHGSQIAGTNAAATRWRIAAAPAARDRFGAFERWRWQVTLERSRSGRTGEWLIEWNHVAHRFRVVEGVADRALAASAGQRRAG
jgi:protein ImuA